MGSASRDRRSTTFSRVALLITFAVAVIVVHWPALFSFFSADDLIHLQQAANLLPTPRTPWRFLTQVLYFRGMLRFLGPWPSAFMLVNLLLHILNVVLVWRLLVRHWVGSATASLAAVLFAASPLLTIVIGHAVIINDIAGLTLSLLALTVLRLRGRMASGAAAGVFALALMCKESVLFLPLLALFPIGRGDRGVGMRRLAPVLAVMTVTTVAFFVARALAAAPSGTAYAMGLWPAPFHNLMTYTAWYLSLWNPLPDLVRSMNPSAWRIALPAVLVILTIGWRSPMSRPTILFGLAWWVLGLTPVLPLKYSAYPHYIYVALPGFALAVAASLEAVFGAALAKLMQASSGSRVWAAGASLIAFLFVLQSMHLVDVRYRLRVAGADLPLDPQIRSMFVAGRATYSLAAHPPAPHTRLAIITATKLQRVYGARTGREYTAEAGRAAGYDLLRVVLNDGRALRVFYPQLDSVVFVERWGRALRGFVVAAPTRIAEITVYGDSLAAHLRLVKDIAASGDSADALAYVDSLRLVFGQEAPSLLGDH